MIQSRGSCEYSFGSHGEGSFGNTWMGLLVILIMAADQSQTKFHEFISLTVTDVETTLIVWHTHPEIETNNMPILNNQTFITAELSPIHIGRLIPPRTPVGMERGLM